MTLDDIIGQNVPVSILRRGLATGTLGHAYLFSGEPGLGKQTTARAVAQELQLQGGSRSELHVLSGDGSIGIDEIRAIRQQAAYSSTGNAVWIITDAERMTTQASNALLKTLEEPRPGTYFFLTTSKMQSLLPTIISRCQHLPFRAIDENQICYWLGQRTGLEPDDPKIRSVARLSQGSIGRAWEYWEGSLLEYREGVIRKLIKVPTASYPEVLGLSQTWPEDRNMILQDLQLFLEWHRDLLTVKNEINASLYNPDYKRELQKISAYYSNHSLFQIIQEIAEFSTAVQGNARIRFGLGYLLLLMKKGALT